jgi:hypothetical protein
MGNQAGGQTENPAGGGQRGFWLGVWGLWLWPPSQSSNNDPETSFQNILRGTHHNARQRRALRRGPRDSSGVAVPVEVSWLKNPAAPAVKREAEEDWGR